VTFRPYPQYKASGVEWLGDVPEGWAETLIKYEASFFGGGTPSKDELQYWSGEIPWVSPKDMKRELIFDTEDHVTELGVKNSAVSLLPLGCVLIVVRSGILKHTIPVALNMVPVTLNQDMRGVKFGLRVNPNFFLRWVQGNNRDLLNEWSKQGATVESIEHAYFANSPMYLPSIEDQINIATFLDRETAKIDTLIAKQEAMIELLKEKRQAVVSHAVTKGLDPDVPMKASGVEWLGDVPENWSIRAINLVSTKITNGFVGPTRDILVSEGIPYIQATHVKRGRVQFDDGYFVTKEWSESHAKSILKDGDVLIVQTGAGTGDVALCTAANCGFNCHALIIVTPDSRYLTGAFLAATLQCTYGRSVLQSIQTGAMHPHLNCGEVKFVKIPLPPIKDQERIVASIQFQHERIDALIAKAQQAIILQKEHRTALISAAVTGKIDVRRENEFREAA
jgi:type I restriction enzyme S subunit